MLPRDGGYQRQIESTSGLRADFEEFYGGTLAALDVPVPKLVEGLAARQRPRLLHCQIAIEFEENLGKLQESLKELDALFGTLNNPTNLDD